MIALAIVVASLMYAVSALHFSRYVLGIWKYNDWKNRKYGRSDTYETHDYGIGGEWFGAFVFCLVAMPIAAFYVGAHRGPHRGFDIAPKHYRDEQKIKAQEEHIKRLERELEVTR